MSVEAAYTQVCAKPDKPFAILEEVVDRIARQPVLAGKVLHDWLLAKKVLYACMKQYVHYYISTHNDILLSVTANIDHFEMILITSISLNCS